MYEPTIRPATPDSDSLSDGTPHIRIVDTPRDTNMPTSALSPALSPLSPVLTRSPPTPYVRIPPIRLDLVHEHSLMLMPRSARTRDWDLQTDEHASHTTSQRHRPRDDSDEDDEIPRIRIRQGEHGRDSDLDPDLDLGPDGVGYGDGNRRTVNHTGIDLDLHLERQHLDTGESDIHHRLRGPQEVDVHRDVYLVEKADGDYDDGDDHYDDGGIDHHGDDDEDEEIPHIRIHRRKQEWAEGDDTAREMDETPRSDVDQSRETSPANLMDLHDAAGKADLEPTWRAASSVGSGTPRSGTEISHEDTPRQMSRRLISHSIRPDYDTEGIKGPNVLTYHAFHTKISTERTAPFGTRAPNSATQKLAQSHMSSVLNSTTISASASRSDLSSQLPAPLFHFPRMHRRLFWISWVLHMFLLGFAWFSVAPIHGAVAAYYKASSLEADFISIIHPLVYLILLPFGTFGCTHSAFDLAILFSILGQIAGAVMRYMVDSNDRDFGTLFGAQVIIAVLSVFLMDAHMKATSLWLESDGSTKIATSASYAAFFSGIATSFILSHFLTRSEPNMDFWFIIHMAVVCVLSTANIFLLIHRRLSSLPLKSTWDTTPQWKCEASLFKQPQTLLITVIFSINFGVVLAFLILLNEFSLFHGYDEDEVWLFGLLFCGCGLLSNIVCAFASTYTSYTNQLCLASTAAFSGCLLWYNLVVGDASVGHIQACMAIMGFFALAPLSVYEVRQFESRGRIGERSVVTILWFATCFVISGLVLLFHVIRQSQSSSKSVETIVWVMFSLCTLSTWLSRYVKVGAFLRPVISSRRLHSDTKMSGYLSRTLSMTSLHQTPPDLSDFPHTGQGTGISRTQSSVSRSHAIQTPRFLHDSNSLALAPLSHTSNPHGIGGSQQSDARAPIPSFMSQRQMLSLTDSQSLQATTTSVQQAAQSQSQAPSHAREQITISGHTGASQPQGRVNPLLANRATQRTTPLQNQPAGIEAPLGTKAQAQIGSF